MTVQIDPADYREFSKQLRQAERGIRLAIRKRVREAGKPLSEAVVREGAERMPSRGGLRDQFLRRGNAKLSQTTTSIRIVLGRRGSYIGSVDRTGRVRHPLFGDREHWYTTRVTASTWRDAFEDHKDEAIDTVSKALVDVVKELTS